MQMYRFYSILPNILATFFQKKFLDFFGSPARFAFLENISRRHTSPLSPVFEYHKKTKKARFATHLFQTLYVKIIFESS